MPSNQLSSREAAGTALPTTGNGSRQHLGKGPSRISTSRIPLPREPGALLSRCCSSAELWILRSLADGMGG